jgi:hypothetical protein
LQYHRQLQLDPASQASNTHNITHYEKIQFLSTPLELRASVCYKKSEFYCVTTVYIFMLYDQQ